jgi:hypothetical protein
MISIKLNLKKFSNFMCIKTFYIMSYSKMLLQVTLKTIFSFKPISKLEN